MDNLNNKMDDLNVKEEREKILEAFDNLPEEEQEKILKNFETYVLKNNDNFDVLFSDKILQRCMKNVPEKDTLTEIISACQKYLEQIEQAGIHVGVTIDQEKNKIFIDIIDSKKNDNDLLCEVQKEN